MMGPTHRAGAVFLSFPAVIPVLKLTQMSYNDSIAIMLFVSGSLLTSRLPDIDIPSSGVSKRLWPISWILSVIHSFFIFCHKLTKRKFRLLGRICRITGHRGLSHTFFMWGLFCLSLIVFSALPSHYLSIPDFIQKYIDILFIGMGFGYLTHLFLDYFSGSLHLFEPFSSKKSGKRLLFTNSPKEKNLCIFFKRADMILCSCILFLFVYQIATVAAIWLKNLLS